MKRQATFLLAAAVSGCHANRTNITGPDIIAVPELSGPIVRSSLGIAVQASGAYGTTGGKPIQAMADRAQATWQGLMYDLGVRGGMQGADPNDVRGISVVLEPPYGDHPWLIMCPGGVSIGGSDQCFGWSNINIGTIHISGQFLLDNRPGAILGHEMAHIFCWQTLGHTCLRPGSTENTASSHWWPLPKPQPHETNQPEPDLWHYAYKRFE